MVARSAKDAHGNQGQGGFGMHPTKSTGEVVDTLGPSSLLFASRLVPNLPLIYLTQLKHIVTIVSA